MPWLLRHQQRSCVWSCGDNCGPRSAERPRLKGHQMPFRLPDRHPPPRDAKTAVLTDYNTRKTRLADVVARSSAPPLQGDSVTARFSHDLKSCGDPAAPTTAHGHVRRFVVVALPRTGTNYVRVTLNQHPNIVASAPSQMTALSTRWKWPAGKTMGRLPSAC